MADGVELVTVSRRITVLDEAATRWQRENSLDG